MDLKQGPRSLLKFLASLKLAVVVLLSLAVLIAAGTIVEARFDAIAASKLVYRTPWMFGVLGLLSFNLIAVMVDRWPWKRRHLSFILAHIGILLLLSGALLTMMTGLDGSLRVPIGQSNRFVSGPTTEIMIWSSFDGDRFTKLEERDVDFFLHRPAEKPLVFPTDAGTITIDDYKPYMLASRRVKDSVDPRAGSAMQFQVRNERVNVTEWVVQNRSGEVATHDFGPAQIHLGPDPGSGAGANEIYVTPAAKAGEFRYAIYRRQGPSQKGTVKIGQVLPTGWMGLEFTLLQFLPKAQLTWDFQERERPTPLTNAAIQISFQGQKHWLQEDDVLKLFSDKAVYIVSYGHKRIDIGFDLQLKHFEIGRYPGTARAAAYESRVFVDGVGDTTISMNEPLKHQGLTIYQASFQDGPDGSPIASIFSVNYDPGRWLKYLGSLIISLGVVILFYDRRKAAKAQMAPKVWED